MGKKKNQKIVYHSLTEYELWSFRNKEGHFLYPLSSKEQDLLDNKRDTDLTNECSLQERPPTERYTQKIIYSNDPLVTSLIEVYVSEQHIFITIQFDKSYPKYFATNYAKVFVDQLTKT